MNETDIVTNFEYEDVTTLTELDKLILKIEELRDKLNQLINESGDLKHPDVLMASKKLDEALNEYQELLQKVLNSDGIDS